MHIKVIFKRQGLCVQFMQNYMYLEFYLNPIEQLLQFVEL